MTRSQQMEVRFNTCNRLVFGLVLVVCAGLPAMLNTGCSHIIQRAQSPETESMEFSDNLDQPTYVGDVAVPTGLQKMKVDGIGLVTQLEGTGSEPPASGQRDYLIAEIKTHHIEDINGLLESKDNSMALLMGMIPPGARKGDRFDVLVQCKPGSKTRSLAGGFLMQARMKPFVQTSQSISFGHNSALVKGRLIADSVFESEDDESNAVSAFIPGGGVVTRERTNELRIATAHQSIRTTTMISRAINDRFSTRVQGSPEGVTNPVNDQLIEILIPEDYRHNVGRYFHVVMNIAFDESAGNRVNRLERLERELHQPDRSSDAAIKLEAIGEEALNILKRGLRSENAQVQFHSAEALAYMQDNSGAEILADAAEQTPAYRWHALTALTSLDDSATEKTLVRLFNSQSAETRYGAFKALRESNPDSLYVDGEFVGREFMMHTVPSDANPMIHVSRSMIPEIVLFGGDQKFNQRLVFLSSGLTVKSLDESRVMVKRYLQGGEEQKIVCSNRIVDVIRQMVKLGADYGDTVMLLKDARRTEAIDSQLVINAIPKLSSSYRLVGTESVIGQGQYVSGENPSPSNSTETSQASQSDSKQNETADSSSDSRGIFRKFW